MAVYTEIADEEVQSFAEEYDIGRVVACKGIAEGIENSNFLLVTEQGPFILTLYERRVKQDDLPFFLGLMEHLAARGIPCPTPIRGRDGRALRRLAGRCAAVVTFLGVCGRDARRLRTAMSSAGHWRGCIRPAVTSRCGASTTFG